MLLPWDFLLSLWSTFSYSLSLCLAMFPSSELCPAFTSLYIDSWIIKFPFKTSIAIYILIVPKFMPPALISLSLSLKPQTYISNCLLHSSTWISNRLLETELINSPPITSLHSPLQPWVTLICFKMSKAEPYCLHQPFLLLFLAPIRKCSLFNLKIHFLHIFSFIFHLICFLLIVSLFKYIFKDPSRQKPGLFSLSTNFITPSSYGLQD